MKTPTAGQRGRDLLSSYATHESGTDGSEQNALVWLLADLLHAAKDAGWDFDTALNCAREAVAEEALTVSSVATTTVTSEIAVWMGGPPEAVCQDCYEWGPLSFLPSDLTDGDVAVGKAADCTIVTVLSTAEAPDGKLVHNPVEPGTYPFPGTHAAAVSGP